MNELDSAVIQAIEQQVPTPEAISQTVQQMFEIVQRELRQHPDKPRKLEAEARKVRKELEHFMRFIAEGKAPESVLVEIKRKGLASPRGFEPRLPP